MGLRFLLLLSSHIFRFNLEPSAIDFETAFNQSLIVVGVYCGFELVFRSFAGIIRHTTIRDIFHIILATTSSLIVLIALTIVSRRIGWYALLNVPLSIILIHYVTINTVLFTTRILIKMFDEMVSVKSTSKKNVIIFGAGSLGLIVTRVIMYDKSNDYNIVAFLDNNKKLQHKSLDGITVLAPKKLTAKFLEKHQVKTIIFAIRDLLASEKTDIFRFAVNLGLEVLEVPAVNTWLNGQLQLDQLKRIKVQDLLSRDPIQLNMGRIAEGLRNRTILVTGAAGSIGSEIVRQLTRFDVKKLILNRQCRNSHVPS